MASRRLVQYVVLRGDLQTNYEWPTGALIAQACHATTAVMHLYRDDENTLEYVKDLDNMHKVLLKAKDQDSLQKLAEKLNEETIDYKLWIEQPENIATCLATKPYPKEDIQNILRNLICTNKESALLEELIFSQSTDP